MENTKLRKLKRKSSAIVAAVLIIALILTGTFAWVSTTQRAKNEVRRPGEIVETPDYDVILHDDFDKEVDFREGGEKSVYVENYGEGSLYIRIRLDEYMETGKYAGLTEEAAQAKALADGDLTQAEIDAIISDGGSVKQAASLVAGANFENEETWTPHVPLSVNTTDDCSKPFHNYWDWSMGGEKNYLPQEFQPGNILPSGAVQDPTEYEGTEINVEKTLNATKVITMAKWIAEGMKTGSFWVIDTDGWAYWAQALVGGDATGLLLSQITLQSVPDDDYYYAINVLMQAASAGDWGFDITDSQNTVPTGNALTLLNVIAGLTPPVEITVKSVAVSPNSVTVEKDDTQQFTAVVTMSDGSINEDGVTWSLNDTSNGSSIDETGMLTVSGYEINTTLTVTATSIKNGSKIGSATVTVSQAITNEYQLLNGGFETGDLTGWTVVSGTAFASDCISSETTWWAEKIPFNKEGTYFLNGWGALETKTGVLRSSEFTMGGNGWISFRLGGGKDTSKCYISVKKADGTEVARFGNTEFYDNGTFPYPEAGMRLANMEIYKTNLSEYMGETLYFEIVDNATSDWGVMFCDAFNTYLNAEPQNAVPAINLVP